PGRTWPAIAARFARLAYGGHLTIDDPDVAARQFLGLVNAELQTTFMLGGTPREDEVVQSATNGVRTFLRAFGKRPSAIGAKKHTALANA
ncbi:TetR/AcrR family transcriptional regulator C-terminal domain-containing protein, partial [Mesorhizobium sp. M1C.F.Ca.ET.188.01.1.1]